ncbi:MULTISPECIES: DUF4232 domain-containing protein [Streptomyces]|uniref:DUF4232 domain-containing protein n=1 Tax=Streptomyces TaxID=1883 RepID=UPI001E5154E9|nr:MULTISPECIES: DUF4232 domain-containing protein [Streptomyces]UFQ16625.1 DUF4232 domain-containing protein [Streptomyces huasconensis]WCL86226.1 DUF4232 domain-containing protein [Streptomyces sp. JCM 35825]
MKLTHASKTLLAGLTLLGALSLTACNGDDGADASSSAGTKPTAVSEGTGSDGAGSDSGSGSGGSTTGGTGADQNGKAGICRSDELEVTAHDNSTDKTEGIVTVVFKNGGSRDCTINGYAGVNLKSATGDTLSVGRNGEQAHSAVLKDGESAAFNITFPINNSGGSGVRIAKILVTPPNETKTVTIAWPAGSLPVDNPDAPSGTKLSISPVGKVSDSPAG